MCLLDHSFLLQNLNKHLPHLCLVKDFRLSPNHSHRRPSNLLNHNLSNLHLQLQNLLRHHLILQQLHLSHLSHLQHQCNQLHRCNNLPFKTCINNQIGISSHSTTNSTITITSINNLITTKATHKATISMDSILNNNT